MKRVLGLLKRRRQYEKCNPFASIRTIHTIPKMDIPVGSDLRKMFALCETQQDPLLKDKVL